VSELGTWWLRARARDDAEIPRPVALASRRITPVGVLVGRSAQCDVVVPDEQVSRRQVLVYLSAEGPRLEVLGRAPTRLRGEVVSRDAELLDADVVELPGVSLEISFEPTTSSRGFADEGAWVLEAPSGALFGMSRSPYVLGGGGADDLRVEGWPPAALTLRATSEATLVLEASVEVVLDGTRLPAGAVAELSTGASVELGGARVRLVTGGAFGGESTAAVEESPREVRAVTLEFMPRGGRLTLELQSGETRALYLADRRCDLVAALLQPPEPHVAGQFLDDELVIARVWGKQLASRTNLNVLVHRLRKDLARIGLDGAALLQRSDGGGATRFALAEGARVVVC
jgi:hypothetical protein